MPGYFKKNRRGPESRPPASLDLPYTDPSVWADKLNSGGKG